MFGKLFKRRGEDIAAAGLYTQCLKQSRLPVFYGAGKVDDSYNGRIDLLTLHMTVIMAAAQKFGAEGRQLNQALYDVMVQDFNIAMREEGLADTGISRRIKPMISLFFERTKAYTQALHGETALGPVIKNNLLQESANAAFASALTDYIAASYKAADGLTFEALKSGHIAFAPFNPA